ncbi:transcriptional repressor, CopY family [Desulfofarcimen acetoxidans DSM 771]|uniref:Transcriptional repressor, CopY family n=1 Tax=Desulfofarcimen acetoxidans (strain ATCC 49208 / DSM 771 / KCTC 5769 / VKM B-1644 / 5575) TaxID=485916 RepID=C8W112_DESAS|nr:BlaI/MecI/CopY family transcriptional regulator [Desulfofarcimen acetoxidans]ACV63408.1 transcriptional repressor, CopY family [Desulfofarcimen acetoxidans DSM 771]
MSIPKISDSEWEVMKVIWKSSPLTSEEIIASLSEKKDWSPQTIKTFINRLLKKGAIGYEKTSRSYVYYPTISEKECVLAESKNFIERVYDGAAAMFFANFIEEKALSEEEIAKLKNLLEGKKRK